MGHRLSRIYTRTGDGGDTGLADGSRIAKDAARIHLLGDADELNCQLGLLLNHVLPSELRDCLSEIQHLLFDLGGDLSILGRHSLGKAHIDWLESWLDHINASLPALKEFILPGGNPAAAHCHIARTICRRAERRAVQLAREEPIPANTLIFLNRLSDFLFVAARILARQNGGTEVLWQPQRPFPYPPSR